MLHNLLQRTSWPLNWPNMDMKATSGRSRARQQSSMDVAQMAPASSGEERASSRCPLLKAGLTECHTSIAHALYWDHPVAWHLIQSQLSAGLLLWLCRACVCCQKGPERQARHAVGSLS